MGKAGKLKKYQEQLAADSYQNALVDQQLQQYQAQQVQELKDASALSQYQQQLEISSLQKLFAFQEFDKSEQAYFEQLFINDANAQLAINNQQNIFEDRLTDIEFQYGDLALQYETEKFNQNLAYDKAQQSFADAVAMYGLQEAQLEDRYKNAVNNALSDIEQAQLAFKETQLDIGIERARRSTELKILEFAREQQKKVEQFKNSELNNQKKQVRAEYNFASMENLVRSVQEKGSIRAQGRQGASSSKLEQGAQAVIGLNQAQVADNLMRSNESIALERLRLNAEAKYNKQVFQEERVCC